MIQRRESWERLNGFTFWCWLDWSRPRAADFKVLAFDICLCIFTESIELSLRSNRANFIGMVFLKILSSSKLNNEWAGQDKLMGSNSTHLSTTKTGLGLGLFPKSGLVLAGGSKLVSSTKFYCRMRWWLKRHERITSKLKAIYENNHVRELYVAFNKLIMSCHVSRFIKLYKTSRCTLIT